ncbi:DUF803 domain membrane protein, partial [Pseudohyphozyma bogoriensis]
VVNPSYFVGFSTSTIIASIILFHGLNTTGGSNTVSLLCGLYIISLGVYLLNLSHSEPIGERHGRHSLLETGVLGSRLSLSNRLSMSSDDGVHRRGGNGSPSALFDYRENGVPMENFDEDEEEEHERRGLRDKIIGIVLALCSSAAIGASSIITKLGLISASEQSNGRSSDSYAYLNNRLWWAGMLTMVAGELLNFSAYAYAPPILVTPLGAMSVIVGAVLAPFYLGERLGRIGLSGCSLCLVGSIVIILHAPEDKPVNTVDEILAYAVQPGFLFYCFICAIFCFYMIYVVAPKHGDQHAIVYISICSVAGSVSIMAIKGFGVALRLTFAGQNQLMRPATWIFAVTTVGCILVQMNYINKALDLFPTTVVNPIYCVVFSSATIVASIILFQGLNTKDPANTVSLLAGFYTIALGVYLVNLSHSTPDGGSGHHHSVLDTGVLGSRLSLSSRISMATEDGMAMESFGEEDEEEGSQERKRLVVSVEDRPAAAKDHEAPVALSQSTPIASTSSALILPSVAVPAPSSSGGGPPLALSDFRSSSWQVVLRTGPTEKKVVLWNQEKGSLAVQSQSEWISGVGAGAGAVEEDEDEELEVITQDEEDAVPAVSARCPLCLQPTPVPLKRQAPASVPLRKNTSYFALLETSSRAGSPRPTRTNRGGGVQEEVLDEESFAAGYYSRFFQEIKKVGHGGSGTVVLVRHMLHGEGLGLYAIKKGVENTHFSAFGPPVPALHILMQFINGGSLDSFVARRRGISGSSDAAEPGATSKAERIKMFRMRNLGAVHLLRVDEIVGIFEDVVEGLAYLHGKGILHLDLKADNVLLQWEEDAILPVAKISDLGSSVFTREASQRARVGGSGTLDWTCPESWDRDPKTHRLRAPDRHTDLWSLGLILHLLCFFSLPYHSEDPLELEEEIKRYPGFFTSDAHALDHGNHIPHSLLRIISRLVNREPSRRPHCEDVLMMLGHVREESAMFTLSTDTAALVKQRTPSPTTTRPEAIPTTSEPILVTPLGGLSVIVSAVLAPFWLGEKLGKIGIAGCSLCLVGSVNIILNAPADKAVDTVDQMVTYAMHPGFLCYCAVCLFYCVFMILAVAPKYGRQHAIVDLSICSFAGSVSVMAVKGLGAALTQTLAGDNQFGRLATWLFAVVTAGCILIQMNFYNKALDLFPTT